MRPQPEFPRPRRHLSFHFHVAELLPHAPGPSRGSPRRGQLALAISDALIIVPTRSGVRRCDNRCKKQPPAADPEFTFGTKEKANRQQGLPLCAAVLGG